MKNGPREVDPAVVKKSEIPNHMQDKDRLSVLLAAERIKFLKAEESATLLHLNEVRAMLNGRVAEEVQLLTKIRHDYSMGLEDTFDSDTGLISRR